MPSCPWVDYIASLWALLMADCAGPVLCRSIPTASARRCHSINGPSDVHSTEKVQDHILMASNCVAGSLLLCLLLTGCATRDSLLARPGLTVWQLTIISPGPQPPADQEVKG